MSICKKKDTESLTNVCKTCGGSGDDPAWIKPPGPPNPPRSFRRGPLANLHACPECGGTGKQAQQGDPQMSTEQTQATPDALLADCRALLQRLQAVCDAASDGPWMVEDHGSEVHSKAVHTTWESDDGETYTSFDWVIGYMQVSNCPNFREDAAFIAASRTWVPLLLADYAVQLDTVAERLLPEDAWWCEHCKIYVAPDTVTYSETHGVPGCGYPVGAHPLRTYALADPHRIHALLTQMEAQHG